MVYWGFFSCAQIIPPTGGEKDTTPPKLDSLESTANFQTNFRPEKIELTFDEWLQLKDVVSEVVVSPPLQSNLLPKISITKKTVNFEFPEDETLRDEATYVINFGDAVRDLNEGNIVPDLRFVFSTGGFIDSLEVRGKVIDALTGEGVQDVSVFLYDNLSDTVPRTQKPFYFSKTNEAGVFRIQNLKSDTFKVFAVVDQGSKNIFDDNDLQLAFPDSFILVNEAKQVQLSLRLFERAPKLRFPDDEQDRYGWVKLQFNRTPPPGLEIRPVSGVSNYLVETEKDTVHLWYDKETDGRFQVFVGGIDSLFDDTLMVKSQVRSDFFKSAKLRNDLVRGKPIKLEPNQPVKIRFTYPIQSIDTSLMVMLEDSIRQKVKATYSIDSVSSRNLLIHYPWKEGVSYLFRADSAAVVDFFDLGSDSIFVNLSPYLMSEYGDLAIRISDIPLDTAYVIQLFRGKLMVEEFFTQRDSVFEKNISAIPTGIYALKIIEDLNANKKWDSGDYDLKRQAEYIFDKSIEEVRSGWEVNAGFTIQELKGRPAKAIKPPILEQQ